NLETLVNRYCSNIQVVATAASVAEARKAIATHSPDLVFLDINMHLESGFDLLDTAEYLEKKPAVVFVTAHRNFAIKAIRYNAFDYLL
ncbi:LytR/AlgR family response regulator transcription factor, partial [Salmonella enterica]|uniref:LytR/AlgR family response regulator transcription factor n=1 Tax=Salmonella enterica TaxID=28901 RepID=UPI0039E93EC6